MNLLVDRTAWLHKSVQVFVFLWLWRDGSGPSGSRCVWCGCGCVCGVHTAVAAWRWKTSSLRWSLRATWNVSCCVLHVFVLSVVVSGKLLVFECFFNFFVISVYYVAALSIWSFLFLNQFFFLSFPAVISTREEKFGVLCIIGRGLQQRKDIVQWIIDTSNWPLPSAGGTFWKRQKPLHALLPLCPPTEVPLEALCVFMRLVPMLDCCQCFSNSDLQCYSLWLPIMAIQNDIYMVSTCSPLCHSP